MQSYETMAETVLSTRHEPRPRVRLRFVALVVAVAVALGLAGTAGPARADNDDLLKALAALAIVGIIAQGLDQRRERPPVYHVPLPEPLPQPVQRPSVPAVCAITIAGNGTRATVYGERCLRAQGFAWRLPERCAKPAQVYGRPDRIYAAQCLRKAGFRTGSAQF